MQIVEQGGISLLIDETGIGVFSLTMSAWEAYGLPSAGHIAELLDRSGNKSKTK